VARYTLLKPFKVTSCTSSGSNILYPLKADDFALVNPVDKPKALNDGAISIRIPKLEKYSIVVIE